MGLATSTLALAGLVKLYPAELDGETKWRGGGWGMPSGLSVGCFVGLASGRLQSTCSVGTEGDRGILQSLSMKFKLDSHYYFLRDTAKIWLLDCAQLYVML